MSAGGKRAFVILGLILATAVISWALTTMEARVAPIPGTYTSETLDAGLDALAASITRWQLIYLPLMQLLVAVGVGLLLDGRFAWLESAAASLFILARIVMIQSTTVSWANSFMWVAVYVVTGGVIAQVVRRWKSQKTSEDRAL